MIDSNGANGSPLLAGLAVKRTKSSSELPGKYSEERDVWVIEGPIGPIPIVANCQEYPIGPVTKVKGERDEMRDARFLPELLTKTDEERERDDPSPQVLLELVTKTAAEAERDDR
jgi:hypothetical protein